MKAQWRSKSYKAYRLKQGTNYDDVIKLPPIESYRPSLPLPGDDVDVDGQYKVVLSEAAQKEAAFEFTDCSQDHDIQNSGGQFAITKVRNCLLSWTMESYITQKLPQVQGL